MPEKSDPRDKIIPGDYSHKVRWATDLINENQFTQARSILRDLLNDDPNDFWVLHLQAYCEREVSCYGLAYQLWMKSLIEARKNKQERWELYNNIGECLHFLWRHQEALGFLRKAVQMKPDEPDIWNNMAVCYLYMGQPELCEQMCVEGLRIRPNHIGCIDNLSVSQLFRRKWEDGWHNYEVSLGGMYRMTYDYNFVDETGKPLPKPTWWEGESGGTLVISGEQGLGDEILFCSAIPDVQEGVDNVIIECNSKLEGLFARSFPNVEVHGSRANTSSVFRQQPTKATSMASMLRFVRGRDSDFPGKPYLVPCPIRRKQWKSKIGKKKIGIAWTGGAQLTGKSLRCIPLKDWKPIIEAFDAHYISLEYNDAEFEIIESGLPVVQYPWATLTNDYDDTAALVAELDLVISVTTSVVHLAGALGTKTWCLVPKYPNWRFGPQPEEDRLIWTKDVQLIRQGENETWQQVIHRVAKRLENWK